MRRMRSPVQHPRGNQATIDRARDWLWLVAGAVVVAVACSGSVNTSGGGSGGAPALGGSSGTGGTGGMAGGTGGAARGTGGAAGGTGGAGAGAGGAIAGTGGRAGSSGADAGPADATGDDGVGLGTPSRCPGSSFAVCQDFESTAVGAAPGGNWAVPTTNYGTGTVAVASDDAARGSHSLKVTIPTSSTSAERYIQLRNLGPLANAHYGRIFLKIMAPTTTLFVHWDLILGAGTFNGAAHRVRWGNTGTGVGNASANWAWLYNVEQGDFGTENPRTLHPATNQWLCIEWMWDGVNQQARFYSQGTEYQTLHIDTTLPGQNRSPEIPIFSSLSFGLAKYQNTDAPLVFWIDEIAVDTSRIGCGG